VSDSAVREAVVRALLDADDGMPGIFNDLAIDDSAAPLIADAVIAALDEAGYTVTPKAEVR
jgi:hypothetical protein